MSETIPVCYPVYGGHFYDDHTAIIAGGGGEGDNGIPNKISVLTIDLSNKTEKIKISNELTIEGKNDAIVSLAVGGKTVLVGQNETVGNIKKGTNKHLRKFEFNPRKSGEKGSLTFVKAVDIEKSNDPNYYQKHTAISGDGSVAVIVSTKVPSVLRIIDTKTLQVKESIQLKGKEEIQDVAINAKGTRIAYVTQNNLVLIQDGNKPTLSYDKFSRNYSLSKVKFTKDEDLLLGVNLKNGAGVLLLHSIIIKNKETNLDELKTKRAKVLTGTFKKITALDISQDDNEYIAVAGNKNTIAISDFKNLDCYKILKGLHSFAISKVAFSPNGKNLLSVSVANTVNVYQIPSNIRFSIKPYLTSIFFLILAIIAHNLFSRITDEQWVEFQKTMAYLYGEEYVPPPSSDTITPASTIQTAFESPTLGTTAATIATGTPNVEYETIVKEGDIVEVQTNTAFEDGEQVVLQGQAVPTEEERREEKAT